MYAIGPGHTHSQVQACGMTSLDSGWFVGCVLRPIDSEVIYTPFTRIKNGVLETAPLFTVPCEGREARFLHCSNRESAVAWKSITLPLRHASSTLTGKRANVQISYDVLLSTNKNFIDS